MEFMVNIKSRAALVETETENFYKALVIASNEYHKHSKINNEEILSEADLVATIHYLSTILASRILGLGETKSELLSQVMSLLQQSTETRVKYGRKRFNEESTAEAN